MAGNTGHRLLAGVDEIGIDLGVGRERSHAEESVLGLQPDGHAFRDVVGDEGRHADAEVHVVAVPKFEGGASGDAIAVEGHGGSGIRGETATLPASVRGVLGIGSSRH